MCVCVCEGLEVFPKVSENRWNFTIIIYKYSSAVTSCTVSDKSDANSENKFQIQNIFISVYNEAASTAEMT